MEDKQKEQLIGQAQALQQQLQSILIQKETMNVQLNEVKNALKEIENAKNNEIYKLTGPLLIKSTKAEVKKDMKEKSDNISLRINTLEKGEKRIKTKMDELREKLNKKNDLSGGG